MRVNNSPKVFPKVFRGPCCTTGLETHLNNLGECSMTDANENATKLTETPNPEKKEWFWEGPVGICVIPKSDSKGEYFWSYSICRSYRRRADKSLQFCNWFSSKNTNALAKALGSALEFMEANEPAQYATRTQVYAA